jgi:hypothetical protein
VVLAVVDRVHTNSIDAQLLELGDIALANAGVGQRICVRRGAAWLIVYTADIEARAALPERCTQATEPLAYAVKALELLKLPLA